MKAFVTGGTGFVGRRVVRLLVERGYDVTCLARHPQSAAELCEFGATIALGDTADRESMRSAMEGADVVFHIAAWHRAGPLPGMPMPSARTYVAEAETVLGLATELRVPKIVYTSSVGVWGHTYGRVVDEEFQRDSPFGTAFEHVAFDAHQIAKGFVAKGAPIVIVIPAGVYGPADQSLIGSLLRLQLRGLLLVVPGADTGLSFAYVDDVAAGHILAAEKGTAGQSYVLGGDVMTIGDAFQVTARLAGVSAPLLLLGSKWLLPVGVLVNWLERFMALPPLLSYATLSSLGQTWWGTSAKAEQELGYTHRTIEEGMADTVLWEARQLRRLPSPIPNRSLLALAITALLAGTLLLWRRGKHVRFR
jgi:dihydroflavonol-4-reductase